MSQFISQFISQFMSQFISQFMSQFISQFKHHITQLTSLTSHPTYHIIRNPTRRQRHVRHQHLAIRLQIATPTPLVLRLSLLDILQPELIRCQFRITARLRKEPHDLICRHRVNQTRVTRNRHRAHTQTTQTLLLLLRVTHTPLSHIVARALFQPTHDPVDRVFLQEVASGLRVRRHQTEVQVVVQRVAGIC